MCNKCITCNCFSIIIKPYQKPYQQSIFNENKNKILSQIYIKNWISLYAGGADELWFRALTRFELVFTELEDALDNVEELEAFDIPGIRIKHHISEDLDGYYGKDRKTDSAAGKTYVKKWLNLTTVTSRKWNRRELETCTEADMHKNVHNAMLRSIPKKK